MCTLKQLNATPIAYTNQVTFTVANVSLLMTEPSLFDILNVYYPDKSCLMYYFLENKRIMRLCFSAVCGSRTIGALREVYVTNNRSVQVIVGEQLDRAFESLVYVLSAYDYW